MSDGVDKPLLLLDVDGVLSPFGAGTPAWVDDDIFLDAFKWAEQRVVPTLLLRTMSSVGLTRTHVDELVTFAKTCAP